MSETLSHAPVAIAPRRRGVRHYIARSVLWVMGWKPEGQVPEDKKYVIIAAPHTALEDGFLMVAFAWWFGLRINWLVKDEIFGGPMDGFLKWTGAIPVNRRMSNGLVDQLTGKLKEADEMGLAIPPEGTRSKRDYWKSGFYFVASAAGVPILLSYLDFKRKVGGLGPMFHPTGDVVADMGAIRSFYQDKVGKFPELQSPIKLRQEDGAAVATAK